MSFDSGPLDRFLNAAIGDDPSLACDLRHICASSARDLADLMRRSRCDANWTMAAQRLKGLAATFGMVTLIELSEQAIAGAPGDPAILRRIGEAIDLIG